MCGKAKLIRILILVSGIIITGISIKILTAPFISIFFTWFIVCLFVAFPGLKPASRHIFFYLSFIPFTLGIYETYLWKTEIIIEKKYIKTYYSKGLTNIKHPFLGYAPLGNTSPSHSRYYKDQLVFDVTYTIDANGLRVSPPVKTEDTNRCILFFGGSFTFGTGVADNETMPYLVGIKTHGNYHIYNFAFKGYGPHQMLSAIKHGMVDDIIKGKPKYVIYQALLAHIDRSAGLVNWDAYGPRFSLDQNDRIFFDGHFNKKKKPVSAKPPNILISLLKKCIIFKKIFDRKTYNKRDIDLFIEIVYTSQQMLESRYPGCEFHVIFWDYKKHKNNTEVLEKLKQKGISLHLISDILPGFTAEDSKYRISPYDRHPSPTTHEAIAEYIVEEIVKQ